MKKLLSTLALLLCVIFLLQSCATSKNTLDDRKADIQNSKEENYSSFVQMNDGSIQNYGSLKLVTGVLVTPYLLADGKIKINAKDIKAYQNDEHYAVSQTLLVTGRKSRVAVETLPGFAVRMVKGKLNVYCKKFYNGQRVVDEYYLQAGSDGEIQKYSASLLNELIKDSPEAYAFFNTKKKGSMAQKLQIAVLLYNDNELMTKN